MKLTLWQQFSSNHSANFDLIAQFKTIEEAEEAYAIVLEMISKIAEYYEAHGKEIEEERRRNYVVYLTPTEVELADKYELKNWMLSVDWAETEVDERSDQGVYLYQNLLYVSAPIETWTGPQPFDELLEKLGATIRVSVEGMGDPTPVVNITCSAENEAKAEEIIRTLSATEKNWAGEDEPRIALPDTDVPFEGSISYLDC